MVIDFRLRPPLHGFLQTLMDAAGVDRGVAVGRL